MHYFNSESAELLFKTAEKMGLNPKKLTDYGLFSIIIENKKCYILQSYTPFNTQIASKLAQHKHITRVILESENFPNIPFLRAKTREEVEMFLQEHTIIIAKPVQGSRSENIRLIEKKEDINFENYDEYIFEKYIKGREFRYVVLNNSIVSVLEKIHNGPINDPQIVNRVSYAKAEWNQELVALALSVAKILHLRFAAVDFIVDKHRKAYVLEVNSAPSLARIQNPTSGPGIDIAKMLLEVMIYEIKNAS